MACDKPMGKIPLRLSIYTLIQTATRDRAPRMRVTKRMRFTHRVIKPDDLIQPTNLQIPRSIRIGHS